MTDGPADGPTPASEEDEVSESDEASEEDEVREADAETADTKPDGGVEDVPLTIAGHEDRERTGPSPQADGMPDLSEPTPPGDDDEVQPVELLVQLAEQGEIEPWDIDIVAVTDAFLEVLDESDLRTSGRALFYASVLLRMKSDALLNEEEPAETEPGPEPWELEPGQAPAAASPEAGPDPVASLEREMDRRLDRKRARGTPQTLDELVRELRDRERDSWWKDSREYDTSGSPHGYARGEQTLDYRTGDDVRLEDEPTEHEVTGTAHAEDIEAVIDAVQATLRDHYDAGRDEVLFAEIENAGGSRVETFLALLFLAHRGQVRLQQDDFFGDLWIQDLTVATRSEGALAD